MRCMKLSIQREIMSRLTAIDTGRPFCIVASMWPKYTIAQCQWGARNHSESHNNRIGLSRSAFSL